MLGVPALELGDPLPLGVLVKANDAAIRSHRALMPVSGLVAAARAAPLPRHRLTLLLEALHHLEPVLHRARLRRDPPGELAPGLDRLRSPLDVPVFLPLPAF